MSFLGGLNVTDIIELIAKLSPEQKQQLYQELGVTEEQFNKMYFHPYETEVTHIPYYNVSKRLLYYVPPILLTIGTIGNLLSFLVLMRRPMRRVSAYNYLAVLSVTDTLILYIGLLRLWIGEITGMDFRDYSDWSCKFVNVFAFTTSDYSVWLLIAVTVERYIATVHSLRAPSMCTLSRARKVIVGIFLLLLAINCHFFWTTEIRDYNSTLEDRPQCDGAEGYFTLVNEVWPWVDAFIYSFLPFVVIISLNGMIINKVAVAHRGRDHLSETITHPCRNNILTRRPVRPTHQESSSRITMMLLTISFTFLITTLPMNIVMIVSALAGSKADSYEEAAKFKLARTITELLMYTNHSTNFFLYLLTGQKFRQQLKLLLCMLIPKNSRWVGSMYSQVEHNGIDKPLPLQTEMTMMTDDRLSNKSLSS